MIGIRKTLRLKLFICGRLAIFRFLVFLLLFTLLMVYSLVGSYASVLVFTNKIKPYMFPVFKNIIDATNSYPINSSFSTRVFVSENSFPSDYYKGIQGINSTTELNHTTLSRSVEISNATKHAHIKLMSSTLDSEKHLIGKDGTNKGTPNDSRKNVCALCFKHDFNYIYDNEAICKKSSDKQVIRIIILIMTVHKNIEKRNVLRNTWLTYSRNNTGELRYGFLLGEIKTASLQRAVDEENNVYHDIIKEDFVDTYTNLTYKTIMAFKWAATKCAHAQYVMKTDDDVYVNVLNLLNLASQYPNKMQEGIVGACQQVASPIRDNRSKWFASVKSYPAPTYPGYCSGTGYVTSMDVARKVYKISPFIPFFHLEDVYVSLCIRKLGLKLTPIPGFHANRPRLDLCKYKNNGLITSHGVSGKDLLFIWNSDC